MICHEWLFGFTSAEFPGLIQITHVMAVKITRNGVRIAYACLYGPIELDFPPVSLW
jgi:hypothetical protein